MSNDKLSNRQKASIAYGVSFMETSLKLNTAYHISFANPDSGPSIGFYQTDMTHHSMEKNPYKAFLDKIRSNKNTDISNFGEQIYSKKITPQVKKDFSYGGKNYELFKTLIVDRDISCDTDKDKCGLIRKMDIVNISKVFDNVNNVLLNIYSQGKEYIDQNIFNNGDYILSDSNDSLIILMALGEWSNQSGGLAVASSVSDPRGIFQYMKTTKRLFGKELVLDYIKKQPYFEKADFSKWIKNITYIVDILNKTTDFHNMDNNHTIDYIYSFIISKAHADTILTPEEKLRLHLKHAQKQRDPLVISRDTYPNLMSNQFSDIYSPLATGMEGRTGWVGADTLFLMRKTNDGYQDLVWGDLATYADKNGLITITAFPDTFYVFDGDTTYTEASQYGVTSINTATDPDFLPYPVYGNTVITTSSDAVTYTDGTTGSLSQVALSISKTYTMLDIDKTTDTSKVSDLPNLKGYGVLPSTRTAMTLYPEMETAFRAMLSRPDISYTTLISDFKNIMDLWQSQYTLSGTEDIAQKDFLAFFYKYLGEVAPFSGRNSISYYGAPSRYILNDIYDYISKILLAKTIIQCSIGHDFLQWFQYDTENDTITALASGDDILTQAKASLNLDTTTPQGDLNFKILGILSLASSHADTMMDASMYVSMNTIDADIAERMAWFTQNTNLVEDADIINIEQSNFGGKVYPWSAQKDTHLIWNKSQGFQITEPNLDVLALNCLPGDAIIARVNGTLQVSVNGKTLTLDLPGAANLGAVIFSDYTTALSVAPFDINPLYLVIGDITLIQGDCYLNDGNNILVSKANLSYNFLFDTILDVGPNNCTINLEHADTLSISDIKQINGNTYTITKDDQTLTIKTEDGIVTLKQNDATLCFLGTGIMQNPSVPNQWQTIAIPVEAPGIYAYQRQNLVTFTISKHTGKDIILLDGYSGRAFQDIHYAGASETTRYFQSSQDEITIIDGDQSIILTNAMWSSLTSRFPTDIRNMTNKKGVMTDINSFVFDMAAEGGVLTTGFYGNFYGEADITISDIILIKGTKTTVDITEEHDTFIEVEDNTSVWSPPRTNSTINVLCSTSGHVTKASYKSGNIVVTANGKSYTIVDAENDAWGLYTVNFKHGASTLATYSNNVGDIPLIYTQSGRENLNFKTINKNNIIEINGELATISNDGEATHNIYKINNNGAFTINVSSSTADVYINAQASLIINGMTSGTLHLSKNMAEWINDGFDIIGMSDTGEKLVVKNYMAPETSITIRVNEASLPSTVTSSYLQDYTATVPPYTKRWNIYLSQNISGDINDHEGMNTYLYDTSKNGHQSLTISGHLLLSPQGNGTISIALIKDGSTLDIPNTANGISDISLNKNTLTFKAITSDKISIVTVSNILYCNETNAVVSKLITKNKYFTGLLNYLSSNSGMAINDLVYNG